MVEGPWFDNQVATLVLHARDTRLTVERTKPRDGAERPALHDCFSRRLA